MRKLFLTTAFIIPCFFSYAAFADTGPDFFEIRSDLKTYSAAKRDKTSVQMDEIDAEKKKYIKSLIGRTVEWTGWINNVRRHEHWLSDNVDYKILIDMEPPSKFLSTWDVSTVSSDDRAMELTKDMPVTINGVIKDITGAGNIELEINVLEQGHGQPVNAEVLKEAEEQKQTQKAEEEAKREALKKEYEKIEQQSGHAYVACKDAVKTMLTSPRTAKFPWMDWEYKVLPDGQTATVQSHVDSQNQFGATIRTNFICIAQYLGQRRWVVKDVRTF